MAQTEQNIATKINYIEMHTAMSARISQNQMADKFFPCSLRFLLLMLLLVDSSVEFFVVSFYFMFILCPYASFEIDTTASNIQWKFILLK